MWICLLLFLSTGGLFHLYHCTTMLYFCQAPIKRNKMKSKRRRHRQHRYTYTRNVLLYIAQSQFGRTGVLPTQCTTNSHGKADTCRDVLCVLHTVIPFAAATQSGWNVENVKEQQKTENRKQTNEHKQLFVCIAYTLYICQAKVMRMMPANMFTCSKWVHFARNDVEIVSPFRQFEHFEAIYFLHIYCDGFAPTFAPGLKCRHFVGKAEMAKKLNNSLNWKTKIFHRLSDMAWQQRMNLQTFVVDSVSISQQKLLFLAFLMQCGPKLRHTCTVESLDC